MNNNFININKNKPLADILRPENFDEIQGLEKIDEQLLNLIKNKDEVMPSLILWGPPGSGKTTLARVIGNTRDCAFVPFSAVLGGVKDIREIIQRARDYYGTTILFIDEIHRFNKAQQDALLPHVEDGTVTLIGATTENPSFSVNSALLSRTRVVVLDALTSDGLIKILNNALAYLNVNFSDDMKDLVVNASCGDARKLINLVESFCRRPAKERTLLNLKNYLKNSMSYNYDKKGDEHYNLISAFIKSLRGSSPSGALYWGFRILESGEDPRFLIRRMIIFASEDIGNADPRALQIATSTLVAFEHIGFPEGKIPIAQCITYLATAPKSNKSYMAMHKALDAISKYPYAKVPPHLINAPTSLMKDLGFAKDYKYPHDFPKGYVVGENYMPYELRNEVFYEPSNRGYEKNIRERFEWLNKDEE